jgi:hypothetical protein
MRKLGEPLILSGVPGLFVLKHNGRNKNGDLN